MLCCLYKVSGFLKALTALFFCNFGRRMYEKNSVHFGASPVLQTLSVSAQIHRNTLPSLFHSTGVARFKVRMSLKNKQETGDKLNTDKTRDLSEALT